MTQDDVQNYLSNNIQQLKNSTDQQQYEIIRNSCYLMQSQLNMNNSNILSNEEKNQYQALWNSYEKQVNTMIKNNNSNVSQFSTEDHTDDYQKELNRVMGGSKKFNQYASRVLATPLQEIQEDFDENKFKESEVSIQIAQKQSQKIINHDEVPIKGMSQKQYLDSYTNEDFEKDQQKEQQFKPRKEFLKKNSRNQRSSSRNHKEVENLNQSIESSKKKSDQKQDSYHSDQVEELKSQKQQLDDMIVLRKQEYSTIQQQIKKEYQKNEEVFKKRNQEIERKEEDLQRYIKEYQNKMEEIEKDKKGYIDEIADLKNIVKELKLQNEQDAEQIKVLMEENIQLKVQMQQQKGGESITSSGQIKTNFNDFSFAQDESKDSDRKNVQFSESTMIQNKVITNNSSVYKVDHLLQSKFNFKNNEDDKDSIDELFSDEDEQASPTKNNYLNYDFLLIVGNVSLQQLKALYKKRIVKFTFSENSFYQQFLLNQKIADVVKSQKQSKEMIMKVYESGTKQLINLSNNSIKTQFSNNYIVVQFSNKDIKQSLPNGIKIYYFFQQQINQITLPTGVQIFRFANNQIEIHTPNQQVECFKYNF